MTFAPADLAPPQVGATAVDAVVHASLAHPEIRKMELLRLHMPPSIESRPGATSRMTDYTDQVRSMQHLGDSFTETFMAIAEQHNDLEAALEVVSYHQPLASATATFEVPRGQLSSQYLDHLIDETPMGQMLVVTSLCETDAGPAHLPLLDFKLASTDANVSVARAVARRQGGGALVDSGSSFHLYGSDLLSAEGLIKWLLRAQLLTRCVDTRWVTHQLLETKAALRLTRGGGQNAVPRVLEWVEPETDASPTP